MAAWDAFEVLGIGDLISGHRCEGYAPSQRRRCRNPINKANRQAASHMLGFIGDLDPQSSKLLPWLEKLAYLLLCVAYHRNTQASDMALVWYWTIQEASGTLSQKKLTEVQRFLDDNDVKMDYTCRRPRHKATAARSAPLDPVYYKVAQQVANWETTMTASSNLSQRSTQQPRPISLTVAKPAVRSDGTLKVSTAKTAGGFSQEPVHKKVDMKISSQGTGRPGAKDTRAKVSSTKKDSYPVQSMASSPSALQDLSSCTVPEKPISCSEQSITSTQDESNASQAKKSGQQKQVSEDQSLPALRVHKQAAPQQNQSDEPVKDDCIFVQIREVPEEEQPRHLTEPGIKHDAASISSQKENIFAGKDIRSTSNFGFSITCHPPHRAAGSHNEKTTSEPSTDDYTSSSEKTLAVVLCQRPIFPSPPLLHPSTLLTKIGNGTTQVSLNEPLILALQMHYRRLWHRHQLYLARVHSFATFPPLPASSQHSQTELRTAFFFYLIYRPRLFSLRLLEDATSKPLPTPPLCESGLELDEQRPHRAHNEEVDSLWYAFHAQTVRAVRRRSFDILFVALHCILKVGRGRERLRQRSYPIVDLETGNLPIPTPADAGGTDRDVALISSPLLSPLRTTSLPKWRKLLNWVAAKVEMVRRWTTHSFKRLFATCKYIL